MKTKKEEVVGSLYVRKPFGLVFGGNLADQFVEAARVFQLDLGAFAVELVEVAEQGDVTVQSGIEASQLVCQLLTHVCTSIHTQVCSTSTTADRRRRFRGCITLSSNTHGENCVDAER